LKAAAERRVCSRAEKEDVVPFNLAGRAERRGDGSTPAVISPIEIAPSILSADYARLGEQVAAAIDAGARRIHVDIMDGRFVPNLTFGPGTVTALAPMVHAAGGTVECHLMVTDPDRYLAGFARAGADVMTVHAEATRQLHRTITAVRAVGSGAGVALNPATPAAAVEEILEDVDLVLVMTVDPGFGGQKLIPATLGKTHRIADLLARRGLSGVELEVDGGIREETIGQALSAGATIAVAGSAIFDAGRPVSACMTALRAAAARAAQARIGRTSRSAHRLPA
jgi:ribulose-phosphate 3-epimerase